VPSFQLAGVGKVVGLSHTILAEARVLGGVAPDHAVLAAWSGIVNLHSVPSAGVHALMTRVALAVYIQTPYCTLSGTANSTKFEARPRG
jgi:hypothetical protein